MRLTENLFNRTALSFILIAATIISIPGYSYSQSPGESIFTKTCQVCHTIGKGRLVGPDLLDIENRRTEDWIISFVKSSQDMVKNNDPEAIALFNEYNKMVMPDQNLSNKEIKEILIFIKERSLGVELSAEIPEQITGSSGMLLDQAGENEVATGQKLFLGEIAFTEGGPACISCHTDNIISGGLLAVELTTVFTRLKEQGINAIISDPPFPVMETAYNNHQITKDEAFYLIAFLKEVDFISPVQKPDIFQRIFLIESIFGGIILFILYGGLWRNRKRKPVNNKIFERQL
jgi:cytochrome c2